MYRKKRVASKSVHYNYYILNNGARSTNESTTSLILMGKCIVVVCATKTNFGKVEHNMIWEHIPIETNL